MPLALAGLRVVDVSQGIPGPLCAMQLADLGADTVKVEPPWGDWLREIGPFHEPGGESELVLQLNRNKRGIALDLKREAGRQVLMRLLEGADVLVEGYRSGVMQRLGFGYEELSRRFPRLIYCSISGHGSVGPLAQAPATEIDMQAKVAFNHHLGGPGLPPVRFGIDLASVGTGFAAFQGIMTALFWRERTGQGQHVQLSMLASMVNLVQWAITSEDSRQEAVVSETPDVGFATADGPALIRMTGVPDGWRRLLTAIGREDVLADPRFANQQSFHLPDLAAVIREDLAQIPFEELRRLVQDEIGGNIIKQVTYRELLDDLQVEILGAIQTLQGHATAGNVKTLDVPWDFDDELAALRFPAPVLGQHTREVLGELGYADSEIDQLLRDRVAVQADC